MSVSTKFGFSLAVLGAVGLSALLIPACSSSEGAGPTAGDGGGSSSGGSGSSSGTTSDGSTSSGGYAGSAGAPCVAPAGEVPNPECDDGSESSCATSTSCPIAEPQCGSLGTASAPSCEPLATNTGTTDNFRMRRIILVAPPKLANQTVQNTVVTDGVDMLEPQCGEKGTGLFNWLLSFNTTANTVTTGGAPQCDTTGSPACDPFTTGYCFVNKNVNGIQVGPVTGAITQATDGTYSTQPGAIPTLNIPIYFGSPPTIILLPISNGALSGVKITDSGNCIGSVNPNALAADCSDDYTACSKWKTGGSLTGFITLKTANTVQVALLSETLCSLLTGDTTGTPVQSLTGTGTIKTCAVDSTGTPTAKGDYCSSPAAAGGCDDSFWLAATFAASAVTIDTANSNPDCQGGGGTDAGGVTDAASSD